VIHRYAAHLQINRHILLREAVLVGALVAAFVTVMLAVNHPDPTGFDRRLAGAIQSIPWGSFSFIPRIGSDIGGGVYGFYVIPALAAAGFIAFRRWRLLALLEAVFVLHYLLISPKLLITAYRPSPLFGVEGTGGLESFPSGHVEWAASFYGFLAYLAWREAPGRWRFVVPPLYAAVVLATMLGRIELGRHWPVDTFAGVLVGLIALRLVIAAHAWPERTARVALAEA
jgi:membrane-associated phospholipid phosphatase